ncbi:hypothetical protein FOQG_17897 [Fusarium oxysporum f. sp. raphani 54005]|uniref:Uncharacterized protein n=1 Tax=Fusarium oxysporum f. sp. raphani 54005 TaxID=1089458 RepID=X0B5K0_FUSOX|nr:hypothetical protein FOQG_17897 [Fusarium oxysporum f. sp. raphani 54005]
MEFLSQRRVRGSEAVTRALLRSDRALKVQEIPYISMPSTKTDALPRNTPLSGSPRTQCARPSFTSCDVRITTSISTTVRYRQVWRICQRSITIRTLHSRLLLSTLAMRLSVATMKNSFKTTKPPRKHLKEVKEERETPSAFELIHLHLRDHARTPATP